MTEGESAKQRGIQRVADNNKVWIKRALDAIRNQLPQLCDGTLASDQFRTLLVPIVGEPNHQNAWGALINLARRLGAIEPTNEYRKSTAEKNHAHEYKVWRLKPLEG